MPTPDEKYPDKDPDKDPDKFFTEGLNGVVDGLLGRLKADSPKKIKEDTARVYDRLKAGEHYNGTGKDVTPERLDSLLEVLQKRIKIMKDDGSTAPTEQLFDKLDKMAPGLGAKLKEAIGEAGLKGLAGIVVRSPDGKFTDLNDVAAEMFKDQGKSVAETINDALRFVNKKDIKTEHGQTTVTTALVPDDMTVGDALGTVSYFASMIGTLINAMNIYAGEAIIMGMITDYDRLTAYMDKAAEGGPKNITHPEYVKNVVIKVLSDVLDGTDDYKSKAKESLHMPMSVYALCRLLHETDVCSPASYEDFEAWFKVVWVHAANLGTWSGGKFGDPYKEACKPAFRFFFDHFKENGGIYDYESILVGSYAAWGDK